MRLILLPSHRLQLFIAPSHAPFLFLFGVLERNWSSLLLRGLPPNRVVLVVGAAMSPLPETLTDLLRLADLSGADLFFGFLVVLVLGVGMIAPLEYREESCADTIPVYNQHQDDDN
jgi:hypothetical protein